MEGPLHLSSTLSSKNFLQPKEDLPSQRFLSVVSFQCSLLPPASARPQSHPHSQNFISYPEGREQPHPQGTRRLGSLSSMWGAEGWGAASSADWVTVSRFSPSAPAPAAVKCAFQHRLHWLLQGQCARCTSVVPDAKETLQQHARVFCLVKGALETWDGDTLFLPPAPEGTVPSCLLSWRRDWNAPGAGVPCWLELTRAGGKLGTSVGSAEAS